MITNLPSAHVEPDLRPERFVVLEESLYRGTQFAVFEPVSSLTDVVTLTQTRS